MLLSLPAPIAMRTKHLDEQRRQLAIIVAALALTRKLAEELAMMHGCSVIALRRAELIS